MPFLIELSLRASWTVRPDTRQLHGLACALFEGDDAHHHLGPDKPFAVWPLTAAPDGGDHGWQLRAAWLPAVHPPVTALAPDKLRIGHVTCLVTEGRHRAVSHAQLAAGPALRAVRVDFLSPAYFSQNGSTTVVPDPRLITGSWRRRWNASLPAGNPLVIDDGIWRDTHRALCLAEFELRTATRDTGHDRSQTGMTGYLILRLSKTAPAACAQALGSLARFAEFCGTGAQTTHGFGATVTAPAGQ